MKGKADMLLANRTLSALVVVSLVFSAFAGLLFLSGAPTTEAAEGDLIVENETYVIENIEQPIDGDVEVRSGGTLIVRDATLSVISNNDPTLKHSITVFAGGTLTLDHGVITTYLDQINPWPFLELTVDGGVVEASALSEFMFPGNITLVNGGTMSLDECTIHALPGELVSQYVVGSSGAITYDSADDGPAITLTDSTLELYDSSILDLPEYPTNAQFAKNITLNGDSTLLAVNSFLAVDFGPAITLGHWYVHNTLALDDLSHAYLYGTSFETYAGALADRAPAVVSLGGSLQTAVPLAQGGDDNTGQPIGNIRLDDGSTIQVQPTMILEVDTWDIGTLAPALSVSSASVIGEYSVAPTYAGTAAIQWSPESGVYSDSSVIPRVTDPPGTLMSFDLPLGAVPTVADIMELNVRFENNGGVGTGFVEFDWIGVEFTVGADAFIYRWLNVTVGDEYGVPIEGASVVAHFTGITELQGEQAFYYTPTGLSMSPPPEVLGYMGETALTFNVTKSDGRAAIPYLSDIITNAGIPESLYVGSYAITGSAMIGVINYSSTETFSLDAYPAMTASDQSDDVTVSLLGASAESPDPARWLVVPPSLHIYDMTYYHAGDTIVAAGGTLRFTNAVFQIVQTSANQRTVYVDGTLSNPALLVFEGSTMSSALPIDIIVQGEGRLQVLNSSLVGVSIVARENAQVLIVNSAIDKVITSEWDSNASIIVKDSDLQAAPILSGTTVGEFTNTSAPSITVERDAAALIYRWIHVTVLDGVGKPLPGALVTARYYISGINASSAVSSSAPDALGVAKVNALAQRLTSAGPTEGYVGNYWVNVTYTFNSQNYYPDGEVSTSVLPYTTPLGRNVTYLTVTIEDALPDLAVHDPPVPVWTDPVYPRIGQNVTVYANIHNDGIARAYDVRVDFYDDAWDNGIPESDELFGSTVIPVIEPGSNATAVWYWTADSPLDPNAHRIIVVVDPLDTIPELNNTAPATGSGFVTVKSLPDVYVSDGYPWDPWIYATDTYVEVDVPTTLVAKISNIGSNTSYDVTVDIFDGGDLVGTTTIPSIAPGSYTFVSMPWTPSTPELHWITVVASLPDGVEELYTTNNWDYVYIDVYEHPDLKLTDLKISPAGSVAGGQTITVEVNLSNSNPMPFSNPEVWVYFNYSGISELKTTTVIVSLTSESGKWPVKIEFPAPVLTQSVVASIVVIVNPEQSRIEESYADNILTGSITVLDIRADLSIDGDEIFVQRGGSNTTGETFGRNVTVNARVRNLGGSVVSVFEVRIGVRNAAGYNHTIHTGLEYNISANATDNVLLISVSWLINLTTPGEYELWVWLDPAYSVSEPYETNNFANHTFTIQQLQVSVTVTTDANEYDAGDIMIITATITYQGTSQGVVGLPGVVFWLIDPSDPDNPLVVPYSNSTVETTDADGSIIVFLRIPAELDSGSYAVRTVVLGQNYDATTTVTISAAVEGGLFPWWVWIVIIVAVVGVVAGFTIYTYVYGLGKLVECGECGAFIPAASKRCPKCGVEFEAGTMKCSECGAWIPAESAECPNCGVKFIGEVEEEADYLERMRKQYDDMVSKYRELAKPELGKKFTDRAFEEWWRRQPAYISFEDWLAKEEEKKKEGPIPCPVCGTLNPKEATVCHKCGTVFGAERAAPPPVRRGPPPTAPAAVEPAAPAEREAGAPPAVPPAAAPRMVIRRPIDRKVVPKKIIKTPLGAEEKKEGEEGGDEENQ